jgi:hypothetical protein
MSATATPETEKIGFSDFVEKLEEVKSSTAEIVQELPIDNELKTNILISVEENIKQVLFNLASKNEYPNWIDYRDKDGKTTLGWGINITAEEMKELPNSITGILVHYLIKGIRDDFGYEFDKKISGKKRLLTKEQKNELLARTQMSFYDKKISDQEITIEDAMYSIKDAYEEVKRYEEMGYILPPEKSKSPYWRN